MADIFQTEMTDVERKDYEAWLTAVETPEEDVCPVCGGANFPEPPSHNYEAYQQVICPICGGIDWTLISKN